jgi:hypothetical protein
MSESLRMMPLAAGHAIAGYLAAAGASLGGFFIANFVLGLVVSGLAGLPPAMWVMANLILFAFAVFVWTVAAFLAFQVRNAAALMVVVSVVGMFGNAGILLVAPGLIVLVGPLVGGTIFNLRTSQTEFTTPLVMSLAGQVLVGAIFFAGAARKYRRPDALALGGWLGLGLLLAWVGISLLSILRPEGFVPGFLARQFRGVEPAVPFCGSVVVGMIAALVPLCNFARLHVGSRGRPGAAAAGAAAVPGGGAGDGGAGAHGLRAAGAAQRTAGELRDRGAVRVQCLGDLRGGVVLPVGAEREDHPGDLAGGVLRGAAGGGPGAEVLLGRLGRRAGAGEGGEFQPGGDGVRGGGADGSGFAGGGGVPRGGAGAADRVVPAGGEAAGSWACDGGSCALVDGSVR